MKRTLHLRRETLGSLTDADLSGVVGGYAFTREGGGFTCGGLARCVATLDGCVEVDLTILTCNCHSLLNC